MQYFATVLLIGHGDALDQAERRLDYPECFETVSVNTVEAGLDLLSRFLFDVVIVGGPWSQLFHMIVGIRDRAPQVPIFGLPPGDVGPELIDRLLELGADRTIMPSTSGSSLRAAVLASCP